MQDEVSEWFDEHGILLCQRLVATITAMSSSPSVLTALTHEGAYSDLLQTYKPNMRDPSPNWLRLCQDVFHVGCDT